MVEAHERLGDDEAALGQAGPGAGQRHGRLELGDEVVAEVADDRLAAALGLLEVEQPRAAADERVAPEPALLDRLEQEARRRPRGAGAGRPRAGSGGRWGGAVGVVICTATKKDPRGSRVERVNGLSRARSGSPEPQARAPAPLARHDHQLGAGRELIAATIGARCFNPQAVAIPDLLRELLLAPSAPRGTRSRRRASGARRPRRSPRWTATASAPPTRACGGAAGAPTLARRRPHRRDRLRRSPTSTSDGLLAFSTLGGFAAEMLAGQRVLIAGARRARCAGVVGRRERHERRRGERAAARARRPAHRHRRRERASEARRARRARRRRRLARASRSSSPNGRLVSRALDNRLGAYVALEAARRVAEAGDARLDVVAVAAVQEELGHHGARAAAFALEPRRRARDRRHLGDRRARRRPARGPARSSSARAPRSRAARSSTRASSTLLLEAAEAEEIPHSVEVYAGATHTDADDLHVARGGVPTGLVSIPLRYMHSPCELASLDDLEAVDRGCVVAFARRLGPETSFLR